MRRERAIAMGDQGGSKALAGKRNPSDPDPKRRGLLRAMFGSFLGLGFTALGAAGALWAAATARFMMPNVLTEPPRRFKAGLPGDYPPGRVETKFKERFGVWIVHGTYQGRRQIYALRTVCTHLGCITIWQESEQRFKCPCHGSGFCADGINFEGPAPRPLERYAIRLTDDGQLEVDKGRTFQEERGEWEDPACYVTA
jgi:cytochrome b6-f complex iron-sulfur subunit